MKNDVVDDESIARLLADSAIFGGLEPDARAVLAKEFTNRVVRRGEVLFNQGDAADGLYLVGSGRLQVILTKDDDSRVVLSEVARGELTGEMALLTDKPRSATIVALRDSHLLFLSTDAFDRVVQDHPHAHRVISTALIDKLMDTIRLGPTVSPATSIVIVPLDDGDYVKELPGRLSASLERLIGSVPVVRSLDMQAALGDAPSTLAVAAWREQIEAANSAVIYVGETTFDPWTDDCVHQADLVLYAAAARGAYALRAVETELRRQESSLSRRAELILLHEPTTVMPRGTRNWLAQRPVDRHHHIRVDRDGDYDRVARLLVGQAIGVVFSGGGARGIAHIGALKALRDRGVPIDASAGASIGAIIAGSVATGATPDEVADLIRAAVVDKSPVDLTFPTVSFAAGARVTDHIKTGAQGLDVEDAWIPSMCVSTNLTAGSLEVHTSGPAWKAIRSSFSVPGLFPPMLNDAGETLVDGGMLDNLPIAPFRALHAGITVIGIDVGAQHDFSSGSADAEGVVSGWKMLATSVRQRTLGNFTSLPRLLMRLTELGSLGSTDRGDCPIRLVMNGVSLLDFNKFDELIATGERESAQVLDEWLASPRVPAALVELRARATR
jgi:predicted acylesterase/phospholipase RssA/CRP-like cAMP-binding protein